MQTLKTSKTAHAGMWLWALIVGLSFPAVGLLSEGLPPLCLTALRFMIAAAALFPFVWHEPDRRPDLSGLTLYAVMGLCLAGFFGAMFWVAHQVSALSMSTLYVSVPLLAYGLGRVLRVERRDGWLLAVLAIGAAGALWLVWVGNADGAATGLRIGLGEAVFFLGCLSSALYPVLSKWGLKHDLLSASAAHRTFWSLLAGGILIGVMGVAFEPFQALFGMTLFDFGLVAYLGVFSSGVTFWLMQKGTGALSPGTVTAYTYLVPFVSMFVLFATAPEVIGWHWLPGSILVLLAIALLLHRSGHEQAVPGAGSHLKRLNASQGVSRN